ARSNRPDALFCDSLAGASSFCVERNTRLAAPTVRKPAWLAAYTAFSAGLRRPSLSTAFNPAKRFSARRPRPIASFVTLMASSLARQRRGGLLQEGVDQRGELALDERGRDEAVHERHGHVVELALHAERQAHLAAFLGQHQSAFDLCVADLGQRLEGELAAGR